MQQRAAKQVNTLKKTLFTDRATFAWLFAHDNVWNDCDINNDLLIEENLYISRQAPQRKYLTLIDRPYLGGTTT